MRWRIIALAELGVGERTDSAISAPGEHPVADGQCSRGVVRISGPVEMRDILDELGPRFLIVFEWLSHIADVLQIAAAAVGVTALVLRRRRGRRRPPPQIR